ncbi:hypothetical protein BH23CHL5_BH23CHL5_07180 [soil metagenome]
MFTDEGSWTALNGTLQLDIRWQADPGDATESRFATLASEIPAEVEVIYAVGGGLPVDAAKFAGMKRGLNVCAVPTALSVDAHLTPASGIRREGCVFYVPTPPPVMLYVDWSVISSAPSWVRAAGICDVLSIATGLWDWRFAEQRGKQATGQKWIPYAAMIAQTLLDEALTIAKSAGNGEVAGLARLLELLALEVQLCNLIGHSRPEEGTEHAFAYSIENLIGKGLPHGDLVGPGILAIAAAQGQSIDRLREALLASGARLDRIPARDAETTLIDLPAYVAKHGLPFGVGHELTERQREDAMQAVWS